MHVFAVAIMLILDWFLSNTPSAGPYFRKELFGMSHIVQIQTQVRDPVAVEAACRRLGLLPPVRGKARLFTSEATGLIIHLPAWNFPLVCDTATGELKYDNYQGHWGDPRELSKFLQAYATEKAKLAARQQGHTVTEQKLVDGTIKLTVQIGGAQ